MIRALGKEAPKIDPAAFVHSTAELIGRVEIGAEASLWPYCVLRGDVNRIVIGARSNVQDLTVIHGREDHPTLVGKGVTVGHRVILHGARIGDGCLIGMGAIVMEAVIGPRCFIAAGTLVLAGMKIPAESLVMGAPAKIKRRLDSKELRSLIQSENSYVKLAQRHRRESSWVPS